MPLTTWTASLALALSPLGAPAANAQEAVKHVLARNGVPLPGGSVERAFDEGSRPATPAGAGSLATPLALLTSGNGSDRIEAAFAFGILAGRSGRAATPPELAAAGQLLTQMITSTDRRSRVAGARVAGRIFAVPFADRPRAAAPALSEGLFALLNQAGDADQLAAMDALGLMRVPTAVTALTARYHFYREQKQRALAGGALEALARIGDPSSIEIATLLIADPWASGRDATALAVAFARERLLADGSVALIREGAEDRARRVQALGYLAELGVAVP
jgi:hypothetical protein